MTFLIKFSFFIFLFISCSVGSEMNADKKTFQISQIDSLMTYCHNNGMFNGSIALVENNKIMIDKSLSDSIDIIL